MTSALVFAVWTPGAYAVDVPGADDLDDVTKPIIDAASDASEPITDKVSDVSEPVVEIATDAVAPVDRVVASIDGSVSGAGAQAGVLLGEGAEGSTGDQSPRSADPTSGERSKERYAASSGGDPGSTAERSGSDGLLLTSSPSEAAAGSASSVDRCASSVPLCTLIFEVSDLGGLLGSLATIVRLLAETGSLVLTWIAASVAFGLLGAVILFASRPQHAQRRAS